MLFQEINIKYIQQSSLDAFLSGCNRSQFKSPVVINSLSSISTSLRNSSKRLNISILELGGLYQEETKNGLLLGLLISTQICSSDSGTKSFRLVNVIQLRMYIATPPPFLFRSRLRSRLHYTGLLSEWVKFCRYRKAVKIFNLRDPNKHANSVKLISICY